VRPVTGPWRLGLAPSVRSRAGAGSAGAPAAAGDPQGYVTPFDSTARVVYRGQDERVHELYYVVGQGWGHGDLSALTKAPPAASAPAG
jgi:hypothetical protein